MRQATLAAAIVAVLAVSPAALAANTLTAKQTLTGNGVRITGSFSVENPGDCPTSAPQFPVVNPGESSASYKQRSDAFLAASNQWYSDHCKAFRSQQADVELTVYKFHAHRPVISKALYSSSGPTGQMLFDETIYSYEVRCVAHARTNYAWHVILNDPYGRAGFNQTASGTFSWKC